MQKPQSYDEVKVGGNYTPPQVGGHKMVIKQVVETKSKTDKNMLVVLFDFDKSDIQPEFFTKEFKDDIRPDKKWPHAGTAYIVCEDAEGKCSRKLKGFITSFEKSNNCEAIWGDKFAAQFKNKKIGGVFGEVENEYNGKITMRKELRWFCDLSKAADATVPDPVYLDRPATKKADGDGFMNIPEGADDSIPWG